MAELIITEPTLRLLRNHVEIFELLNFEFFPLTQTGKLPTYVMKSY